ncbi:MAG TPA: choice-of-anchor tandem repeat NxxGxxAF-containing protein [Rhodanobacteraceae bacterium]|nr:choice-of-anchor tandem repeat NxxGxxAF-containing protein [Rhodanobacteraceae bacterium]
MPKPNLSCTLVALLVSGTAGAALPDYGTLELQARCNLLVNDNGYNLPPGSSFNSITPAIDNAAEVAFPVQVVPDGGSSHPGIWSGSHGVGELVYEGPTDSLVSSASPLNDAAEIVFTLSDTGGADGMYVYDPLAGTASRISTVPVIPDYYGSPDINGAGELGFQANFSSGRALASTGSDGTVIHVGDSGVSPGSPYTYLYTPAFNDQRRIAAKVATSPDQFTNVEIRIFDADGDSQRILANQATDPDSPYSKFDNGLALNDSGVIAVVATRASDNRRVVLRSDGTTTTEIAAVDPAGTIRGIEVFRPVINHRGWVAFRAVDAGGQAIYIGDGTELVRVIGKGDVVDTDLGSGQIGQDNDNDPVFGGAPAIDDNGDIAFVAGLHPEGDPLTEWGSGVFVAYAKPVIDDRIFTSGFEPD